MELVQVSIIRTVKATPTIMYSWEIQAALKEYNYYIPSWLYNKICKESSQIRKVEYSGRDDSFDLWTTDGYHFKFKVYRKDDEHDN